MSAQPLTPVPSVPPLSNGRGIHLLLKNVCMDTTVHIYISFSGSHCPLITYSPCTVPKMFSSNILFSDYNDVDLIIIIYVIQHKDFHTVRKCWEMWTILGPWIQIGCLTDPLYMCFQCRRYSDKCSLSEVVILFAELSAQFNSEGLNDTLFKDWAAEKVSACSTDAFIEKSGTSVLCFVCFPQPGVRLYNDNGGQCCGLCCVQAGSLRHVWWRPDRRWCVRHRSMQKRKLNLPIF